MKLDSIWLQDFKNLKDFAVDFDEAGSGLVTVVLGKNGSGKSNLLEALVVIFRDLYLGRETAFDEDLTKRDKVSLDIFWLKDESLEDSANLPDPHVIAFRGQRDRSIG